MSPNITNTTDQRNDPSSSSSGSSKQEGDLKRRFWRLALFNIGSNLTVPLSGLVDTAMLGWLPEVRFLAGVALASLIFDYIYFGLGFLRMSTTGQTAQAEGAKQDSSPVLFRSLTIAVILATLVLLARPLIEHLAFAVLSGTPDVEAAGRDYFRARVWGAPGVICQLALLGWLLGRERSGSVLVVMSVTNLCNIALNWWFILHLGLEARGAGLATAIAQTAGALVAAGFVLAALETGPKRFRAALRLEPMLSLIRLNSQLFIRTLLLVSCFALFTDVSARLGTIVLASNAILLRWVTLLSYLVDGIAYATETIIGRLWGARDRRQLQSLLHHALLGGSALGALVWLPLVVAPEPIINLFSVNQEVISEAVKRSLWIAPLGLFGALAYVYDGFYLGATQGRRLLTSMLVAAGVSIGVILTASMRQDPSLLWIGLVTLMALRALTLARGVGSLIDHRTA